MNKNYKYSKQVRGTKSVVINPVKKDKSIQLGDCRLTASQVCIPLLVMSLFNYPTRTTLLGLAITYFAFYLKNAYNRLKEEN